MPRPKRKADDGSAAAPAAAAPTAKRATRSSRATKETANAVASKTHRPSTSAPAQTSKKLAKEKKADSPTTPVSNTSKKMVKPGALEGPPATATGKAMGGRTPRKQKPNNITSDPRGSTVSGVELPPVGKNKGKEAKEDSEEEVDPHEPSYWLMKAEPESRIEKGKDVKFSIDDLKNATEPEAWDGKMIPEILNLKFIYQE